MSCLRISLLGPMQITRNGRAITGFRSRYAQALLAYLLLAPGQSHRREHLAALFWPERPNSSARAGLRNALFRLGRALDRETESPLIVANRDALAISEQANYWLDVKDFQQLAATDDHSSLTQALNLYRGDLVEGMFLSESPDFDDWATLERDRLHRMALDATHKLAQQSANRGDLETACRWARRALELEPWQEEGHRLLIRLLADSGKRTAALKQYQVCRQILDQELGVSPSSETEGLRQRILSGHPGPFSSDQHAFLPHPLTPTIGREPLLNAADTALRDPHCRLLTLLGPGGIGKTRLAIEITRRLRSRFNDGAIFVPLSGVNSLDREVAAIATQLHLGPAVGIDPRSQLLAHLSERQLLLTLDAHEHLLDGGTLLADILSAAPHVKALITTRTRLNIPGEQILRVEGLTAQSPGSSANPQTMYQLSDAARLFVQGARRSRPSFAPREQELHTIEHACRRLEGSPLAILLASSWIDVMTPEQIAAQLEGPGQALALLNADWHGVPARERSMRATFDHSWSLLQPHDRAKLPLLATLRDSFDADAAQAVAGASLADLRRWMNHSLLSTDQTGRFSLHDLMREYLEMRLDERPDEKKLAQARHAHHFLRGMGEWTGTLKGREERQTLATMDQSLRDILRAWEWTAEHGQTELLDQSADAMGIYCECRAHFPEGERAFAIAAQSIGNIERCNALRAKLLAWQGYCMMQIQRQRGIQIARDALSLIDHCHLPDHDIEKRAFVVLSLSQCLKHSRPQEACDLAEQSAALFAQLGDDWGMAESHAVAAKALNRLGRNTAAQTHCEKAMRLYENRGSLRGMIQVLGISSALAQTPAEAEILLRQAIELAHQLGDQVSLMYSLMNLGRTLAEQGANQPAQETFQSAIDLASHLGFVTAEVWALPFAAWTALQLGNEEQAKADTARAEQIGARWAGPTRDGQTRLIRGAMHLLSDEPGPAAEALCKPASIPIQPGSDFIWIPIQALALWVLALAKLGQHLEAAQRLAQALRLMRPPNIPRWSRMVLPFFAAGLAALDLNEQALLAHGAALKHPATEDSPFVRDICGAYMNTAKASLGDQIAEELQERGRTLPVARLVEELLQAVSWLTGQDVGGT